MNKEKNVSEDNPDQIRKEVKAACSSLANNVEKLEYSVLNIVDDATQKVNNIISDVKKELSLTNQIKNRPYTFFAGSVVVGVLMGRNLSTDGLTKKSDFLDKVAGLVKTAAMTALFKEADSLVNNNKTKSLFFKFKNFMDQLNNSTANDSSEQNKQLDSSYLVN